MEPPKIPKWQTFERLVVAVHKATARGANVEWNAKLDRRQFDVVMRFRVGSYDYLTVIECKDQNRAVSVEQVEAFITKSRDAGADKSVMVSRSGFQDGAVKVARRHNIDLFELSRLNAIPEELLDCCVLPFLTSM